MTLPALQNTYFVYAVVLLLGGALGFARARSLPSLIAGAVFAVLTLVAGFLIPRHPRLGLGLGMMSALAMTVFFAMRYQITRKPMPAIPVAVLSLLVIAVSLFRLLKPGH